MMLRIVFQLLSVAAAIVMVVLALGGCSDTESPQSSANNPPAMFNAPHAAPLQTDSSTAHGDILLAAAAEPAAQDKEKKPKTYEPIFAGWPKPKLVFIFTGQQEGYLEPCGCAGLENQKGGLSRRHTFLKSLAEKGWPIAAFDVGGQLRRSGKESELQFQITVDSLMGMDYRAVTFGLKDLRLMTPEILTLAVAGVQDSKMRFVAANVTLEGVDDSLLPKYYVFEAGGMKIGVTGILGERFRKQVTTEGIKTTDPEAALAEVVPKLEAEKCDVLVLLSHAATPRETASTEALKDVPGETVALAKKFPVFKFVVSAEGGDTPRSTAEMIPGTPSQLILVGHKGEYAIAVGMFDDAKRPSRYQVVPLDDRFVDSPEMHLLKVALQDQIQQLGFDGLEITPASYPERQPSAGLKDDVTARTLKFVGTKTCADCHTKAAAVFEKTPHAHATDSIVHLDPPRHFDPECLSCHVTGWEPQRFVPFPTGFESLEKTPLLVANGCENCHGPGDAHAAVEAGDLTVTDKQKNALREQMRLPLAKARAKCIECHDVDNSPNFWKGGNAEDGFKAYWPKVEHKGKD